jgi:hypothetical protein
VQDLKAIAGMDARHTIMQTAGHVSIAIQSNAHIVKKLESFLTLYSLRKSKLNNLLFYGLMVDNVS